MQLQKLVYIAHGFTLAMLGEALFADPVEAWPYGPVIPDLYTAYKHYGSAEIRERLHTSTRPIRIEAMEYRAIEVVWAGYGNYSGPELSAMTHKPATPWSQVWFPRKRKGLIPNQIIADYYSRFLHSKEPPVSGMSALEQAAVIGDRDTFVGLVQEYEWTSVREFDRAIQLALEVGAPAAAKYLFREETRRHPSSPAIARYAPLFDPKRAVRLPSNPTLRANRQWLNAHRQEYRGQWIALRNGKLLANAPTLTDLEQKIGRTAGALVTRA